MSPLLPDIHQVIARAPRLWEELRGQRIFITGGTGFFGCWLLEAFCHANEEFSLGAEAVVLSREPGRFLRKAPHLASHPAVHLVQGDLMGCTLPAGSFGYVIHAAVDYCAPLDLFIRTVEGTRRTLDLAVQSGAKRYLFVSSGAVYGEQPSQLTHVPEDYAGGPDTTQLRSAYGEAKRASEFLCTAFHERYGLHATIARGFAFVGPYLPLDQGSAIGNFIADAMKGGPIHVNGDGTPLRSYLYGADLGLWLWTILLLGSPGRPYNVGSEIAHSISEVAAMVAEEVNPQATIVIAQKPDPTQPAKRYLPSTRRANVELGLAPTFDTREAVRRTAAWNRRQLN